LICEWIYCIVSALLRWQGSQHIPVEIYNGSEKRWSK